MVGFLIHKYTFIKRGWSVREAADYIKGQIESSAARLFVSKDGIGDVTIMRRRAGSEASETDHDLRHPAIRRLSATDQSSTHSETAAQHAVLP